MAQSAEPELLRAALEELEKALLTPVVSGELKTWVTAVQQATGNLGNQLGRYQGSQQREQLKQIASSDPDLLARVERLRAEDDELRAAAKALERSVANLAQMVEVAERHESRPEEQRADLEKEGIDLIVRIRKHLLATETWLAEATYRDRGVQD